MLVVEGMRDDVGACVERINVYSLGILDGVSVGSTVVSWNVGKVEGMKFDVGISGEGT